MRQTEIARLNATIERLKTENLAMQAELDALKAKLDKAQKDSERIDFLADKNQFISNVQLPREIVERNLSSLRNAIDEAMALAAQEQK